MVSLRTGSSLEVYYKNIPYHHGTTPSYLMGVIESAVLSPRLSVLSTEILSNKIGQDPSREGIKLFVNEVTFKSIRG